MQQIGSGASKGRQEFFVKYILVHRPLDDSCYTRNKEWMAHQSGRHQNVIVVPMVSTKVDTKGVI